MSALPTTSVVVPSLADLRSLLAEKKRFLASKETELQAAITKVDTLGQTSSSYELKALEEEKKNALAQLQRSTDEIQEVRPRYDEVVSANQVPIPPELVQAVGDMEQKLATVEAACAVEEQKQYNMSQKYLEEYEAHEKLIAALGTRIGSLQSALQKKVDATSEAVTGEMGEPIPHPNEALAALETLSKEREQEALNLARQLRELRHILEAKETRRAQLEAESVTQIQDVASSKDAEIRHMVHQIHQERDMILNDIQDVRVVNREQAFNLRRGQVQKDQGKAITFAAPKTAKLRTPTRTDALATEPVRATTRQAQFRQEPKPSEGELVLAKANEELEAERNDLTTRLHRAASDKSDLLKSIKVAKENSKKETEQRRQLLRELEIQTLTSRRKAAQLDDENLKLEETCEALATTLKNTKHQYEQLTERRNQILPNYDLPVIKA